MRLLITLCLACTPYLGKSPVSVLYSLLTQIVKALCPFQILGLRVSVSCTLLSALHFYHLCIITFKFYFTSQNRFIYSKYLPGASQATKPIQGAYKQPCQGLSTNLYSPYIDLSPMLCQRQILNCTPCMSSQMSRGNFFCEPSALVKIGHGIGVLLL